MINTLKNIGAGLATITAAVLFLFWPVVVFRSNEPVPISIWLGFLVLMLLSVQVGEWVRK